MNSNYKPELESRERTSNSLLKDCACIIFALTLLVNCSGTKPIFLGQFSPCPNKPNCVSSKSSLGIHKIAPLKYPGKPEDAREKLLGIINSIPRTQISMDNDNFIHVEFTSKVFQFVDDVEFYFENAGTIHFRSASRIGHSDMGVNRNRMEKIRQLFTQAFQDTR